MRHGGVAGQVLGIEAQRHVAPLDVGVDVGTQPVFGSGRGRRLEEGLVGALHVEVAQPLHPGVDDDRNDRVALHGEGLAAVELPLGHPAPLLVDVDHRADHLNLTLGVDQRQELVHVAVGVPQREDRIAVALHGADFGALHDGVLAVDVLQQIGVDERMVKTRVEDLALFARTALDTDAAQVVVPARTRLGAHGVEVLALLLGVEVHAGVLHRDERDAHLHLDLLALGRPVGEPHADVVTGQLLRIARIELVATAVLVPLGLDALLRGLHLPVADRLGTLVDTHDEVNREDRLRIVAEGAQQLRPLDFRIAHAAYEGARLVGQTLAQVEQDVALAGREGEARHAAAQRGRYLGQDAVLVQEVGVVARRGRLARIGAAVVVVVHIERARGGHQQQGAHLGASHAAEVHVRKAGEELVVVLVGRRPPARVLVVAVHIGAHHVEGGHRHQAVRADRAGVGRTEVGRTDERIDVVGRFLRGKGGNGKRCRQRREPKRPFHRPTGLSSSS